MRFFLRDTNCAQKWQKNKPRGKVPKASAAREVIQMGIVFFGEELVETFA
jgi:hypothetical protein